MYHIPHESQSEGLEQVQASLEYDVVQAALAERRAELAYEELMGRFLHHYGGWDTNIEGARNTTGEALQAAVDALLAFLGEN